MRASKTSKITNHSLLATCFIVTFWAIGASDGVSFLAIFVFFAVQLGFSLVVNFTDFADEQPADFGVEELLTKLANEASLLVVEATLEAEELHTFLQAAFWAGVHLAAVVVAQIFLQAAICAGVQDLVCA